MITIETIASHRYNFGYVYIHSNKLKLKEAFKIWIKLSPEHFNYALNDAHRPTGIYIFTR